MAAAIGCVTFLTSNALAIRLSHLSSACIVVDKGAVNDDCRMLARRGTRFPLEALERLGGMEAEQGDTEVSSVRVAGIALRKGPLLHTKLLVLGTLTELDYDTGVGERFQPERLWLGSANWTNLSPKHLELGLWIDDARLLESATEYLADVIQFSEPLDAHADLPIPTISDVSPDVESWAAAHPEDWESDDDS